MNGRLAAIVQEIPTAMHKFQVSSNSLLSTTPMDAESPTSSISELSSLWTMESSYPSPPVDPCELFLNMEAYGSERETDLQEEDDFEIFQSTRSTTSSTIGTGSALEYACSSTPQSPTSSHSSQSDKSDVKRERGEPTASKKKRVVKPRRKGKIQDKNDIENRYRKKLETLIHDLAAEIPTLVYARDQQDTVQSDKQRWSEGLVRTERRSRPMIFNKAVEYIRHLEELCRRCELCVM